MQEPTKKLTEPQSIARRGAFDLRAQVTPLYGANLVSFSVDGSELIFWDPKGLLAGRTFTGAFNMWPTPCRLANCSYPFEGRKIVQRKHGEDLFIHGLVRDESMQFRNDGDSITSWVEIGPGHAAYEGFPFRCVFRVTHALHESGLTISYEVENRDTRNLPFGFGVHPFWRIHGSRRDMVLRIPCDYTLELKDLVPTGNVEKVEGTKLDLRKPRHIDKFFVDNAFWKRNPGDTAEVLFSALGKRMTIEASDEFAHMIVYAPARKKFVCVENLTACPNAQNLAAVGKKDVAGLTVVPAGQKAGGWIKYTITAA